MTNTGVSEKIFKRNKRGESLKLPHHILEQLAQISCFDQECAAMSLTFEELFSRKEMKLIVTSRNTWLSGLSFQTSSASGQQLPFAIPVDQDITRKAMTMLI